MVVQRLNSRSFLATRSLSLQATPQPFFGSQNYVDPGEYDPPAPDRKVSQPAKAAATAPSQERRESMPNGMQTVDLEREYQIVKKLGTGRWSSIHLARDQRSGAQVALKLFPSDSVKAADFLQEYNNSRRLGINHNIIETFEGSFCSPAAYFFAQELAQCGSLRDNVNKSGSGLARPMVRKIFKQVIAAVEFIHERKFVHRNIMAKNLFVFDPQYWLVKLGDFGLVDNQGASVKHIDQQNEYHAPELCDVVQNEFYTVDKAVDAWAIGILVFFALTAKYPWVKAKYDCAEYLAWVDYRKTKNKKPPKFGKFNDEMLKDFIKILNPQPRDRYKVEHMKMCVEDDANWQ